MHTRLVRTQPAEKGPNYARQLGWKDPEASGGNTTQPAEKGKGGPRSIWDTAQPAEKGKGGPRSIWGEKRPCSRKPAGGVSDKEGTPKHRGGACRRSKEVRRGPEASGVRRP